MAHSPDQDGAFNRFKFGRLKVESAMVTTILVAVSESVLLLSLEMMWCTPL